MCASWSRHGEERLVKTKLLALLFLIGSSAFAGPRFFVGFGVGPAYGYYAAPPPPPPPAVAYVAPAPGPNFAWIGGYWYPYGGRYAWHAGYWAPRPYYGARWVAPRYYGHYYYGGYWRR
jgi:hypothetical protein